jgi:hypothetical protein
MFFCKECDYKYDIAKNIDDLKKDKHETHQAYFKCNNCGYYENIPSGTPIYTKSTQPVTLVIEKNDDLINDKTLPCTKKYVCPNDKCESHTNNNIKEAVFFKRNHYVTYICKVCKTYF